MVRGVVGTLALLAALSLSGCADVNGDPEMVDIQSTEGLVLEAGKGAIAGLLVDDRFRPLVGGSILLLEEGVSATSNANGEFFFVDLDPGTYTLRTSIDGHEAAPGKVAVEEGLFAEASVIARRVSNLDGVIITEELAAFVSCNANTPLAAAYCGAAVVPDLSGDTQRWQLDLDYSQHGNNVSYWVIELLTDKEAERNGAVKLIVRDGGSYFVNDVIIEGNYLWTSMQLGEVSRNDVEDRNHPFLNDMDYLVQVWAQGLLKEETQGLDQGYLNYDSRGVGVQIGLKAKLLSTVFLYDPGFGEMTSNDYCALCS